METITKQDFLDLVEVDEHYTGDEWDHYFKQVCEILHGLNLDEAKTLEVGPYKMPYLKNSMIMDPFDFNLPNKRVSHQAEKTPWPFEDNSLDLIIATAVWEHLFSNERMAFREAIRLADFMIWLVPFRWDEADCRFHNNVDFPKIAEWTLGCTPIESKVLGVHPWRVYLALYDLRPYKSSDNRLPRL